MVLIEWYSDTQIKEKNCLYYTLQAIIKDFEVCYFK